MQEPRAPSVSDRYTPDEIASFRAAGYWGDDTLVDALDHWASVSPDRPYLSDGTAHLSYEQARSRAYRLAAELRRRGVEAGDRVVVQLPNWNEFALTYLALARLGAILVPAMPIYRHDEVRYVLNHSEARAMVTTGEFRRFDHQAMLREIRPDCPTLQLVIIARGSAEGDELSFDELAGGDEAADENDLGPRPSADDGHIIVYTSGTESRPKGCFHTWNTLAFTARVNSRAVRIAQDDVAFVPSPVAHATGLINGIVNPTLVGAALHLLDVWDPAVAITRIAEHGCTTATTATAFVRMILDVLSSPEDLKTMRTWLCGGAPIPPQLVTEVASTLPNCRLLSHYGRSENFVSTICTVDDPPERSATSDGRAPAGVEIAILDDDNQPCPPGVDGDIC